MNKDDFLKILEDFPGREELAKAEPEQLTMKYSYVNFSELGRKINKRLNLSLKRNEELWFKLLAFAAIAADLWEDYMVDMPKSDDILSYGSLNEAEIIKQKFNERFEPFSHDIISDVIGGITLQELIEFAKSDESLLQI